jgi:hypothetical protein
MKNAPTITDIVINNFGQDKSLIELADDYKILEREIAREKSDHAEDTQRMTALRILFSLQLTRVLKKLAEEPEQPKPRDQSYLKVIK